MTGLLVSDPLATATGLRFPGGDWKDRAALIADRWRQAVPGLSELVDKKPIAPTGYLVLNSTDIRSGCRVVISQIEFGQTLGGGSIDDGGQREPQCREGTDGIPMTLDLLDLYAPKEGVLKRSDGSPCTLGLDWATAAQLSARFPVVTPAGRINSTATGCVGVPEMQLVDGGYNEASGLSTLADMAPQLAELVRASNESVARGQEAADAAFAESPTSENEAAVEKADAQPYVIPIVLFVRNSPGAYVAPSASRVTPELVVPLAGFDKAELYIAESSWLQRMMSSWDGVCEFEPAQNPSVAAEAPDPNAAPEQASACTTALDSIQDSVTGGVVVAAPLTRQGLEAPLGWTLSDYTKTQMKIDLDLQSDSAACADLLPSDYACFGQLLDILPRQPRQ
jgi:hypothetical protein